MYWAHNKICRFDALENLVIIVHSQQMACLQSDFQVLPFNVTFKWILAVVYVKEGNAKLKIARVVFFFIFKI